MKRFRKTLVNINDILIKDEFLLNPPNPRKIQCKRELKEMYGYLSPIYLDSNNYLVDGYISYLILKESGWRFVNYPQ